MNATRPLCAWFEAPDCARLQIPADAAFPVCIGRDAGENRDETTGLFSPFVFRNRRLATMSRRHALLSYDERRGWSIQKANPQRPVFVNEREIGDGEIRPLVNGDRLKFGLFEVVFGTNCSAAASPCDDSPLFSHPAQSPYRNAGADAARLGAALGQDLAARTVFDPRFVPPSREGNGCEGSSRYPATEIMPEPAAWHCEDPSGSAAWGALVECKRENPICFSLRGRVVRIGSHPIVCQVRIEEPGIGDLHAVMRWRRDVLEVRSKSASAPVKVGHRPVRASRVESGDIVTIGNRDYTLEILGAPPKSAFDSAKTALVRRLGGLLAAAILLGGLSLGAGRLLAPREDALAQSPVAKETDPRHLAEKYGLASLRRLRAFASSSAARPQAADERADGLVQGLELLAHVDRAVRTAFLDDAFLSSLESVQKQYEEAVGLLKTHLRSDADRRPPVWLTDVRSRIEQRVDEARERLWQEVLLCVRQSDMKGALEKLQILSMRLVRHPKRVERAVTILDALSPGAEKANANAILNAYAQRRDDSVSAERFLAETEASLVGLESELRGFDASSEPYPGLSEALNHNGQMDALRRRLASAKAAIDLIGAYRTGDADRFGRSVPAVDAVAKGNGALSAMKAHMNAWKEWSAGPAARESLLLARSQFETLCDPKAPILRTIDARLESANNAETAAKKPRDSSREWISALGEDDEVERISRMLAVYESDKKAAYAERIDEFCPDLFSRAQETGMEPDLRNRLASLLREFRQADPHEQLISHRQLKNLLSPPE